MRRPTVAVDQVQIPMRDGTMLSADLVAQSGTPAPALLTRTPYGRPTHRQRSDVIGLARSGWAVVGCDVRGSGESGGVLAPFHQEIADGYDTVEWVASQPWCDGRVAMDGGSYCGATQWLAAASGAPSLGAVAPLMTTARFGDGWCSENGIPTAGFLRAWALRFAGSAPGVSARVVARVRALTDALVVAPASAEIDAEIADLYPLFTRWMDPDDHDYFDPIDLLANADLAVPARQTGGWYDMFVEGGLEAFDRLSSTLDPTLYPQRMLVGPWAHTGAGLVVVGDTYFGPSADADRLRLRARDLEWLQAALDPLRRTELDHRLSVYVLGRATWTDLSSWPPAGTEIERWSLCADGTLAAPGGELTAGQAIRTIMHTPNEPLPSNGGRMFGFWPRSGPERMMIRDADVGGIDPAPIIRYVSAPVERAITVIGRIGLEVVLQSLTSASDIGDVVVRVDRVAPDGSTMLIVEQASRIDRPGLVKLNVGSTAWELSPGERIAVSLSLSSWPRLVVDQAERLVALHHDVAGRCALLLPTLA